MCTILDNEIKHVCQHHGTKYQKEKTIEIQSSAVPPYIYELKLLVTLGIWFSESILVSITTNEINPYENHQSYDENEIRLPPFFSEISQ